jgi:signal transduction histidine kinase
MTRNGKDQGPTVRSAAYSTDKQLLALDALARLTRQFALQPNFDKLLDLVLLTITGQFTVSGAFICIDRSKESEHDAICRGVGRYHDSFQLSALMGECYLRRYFLETGRPCTVESLLEEETVDQPSVLRLHEAGIQVLVPLIIGDSLLATIGLAGKVLREPFDSGDLELLATLAHTISPLLSNSLMFVRMEGLKEWYRNILDSVRQGVLVFDSEFRLRRINQAGQSLLSKLGIDRDWSDPEITPGALFDYELFPGWTELIESARFGNNHRESYNLVAHGASGDTIVVASVSRTGSEIVESSDIIVTLDDVTSQRETERRFFELEKFAEQGVMASSIAHELNNHLALILGGVEIAELSLKRDKLDKVQNAIEKVKKHVGTMERFTDGLTDSTRLDSKKQPLDVNDIVKDVTGFVRIQSRFQKVALEVCTARDLPAIDADPDQIAQLLLNLLNNAADATDGREHRKVTVGTEMLDNGVRLLVSDNGCGVPDRLKDKLFQARFTTKEGGHGLGLVTCGRILDQHSASHAVESTPEQGTTITITFPGA